MKVKKYRKLPRTLATNNAYFNAKLRRTIRAEIRKIKRTDAISGVSAIGGETARQTARRLKIESAALAWVDAHESECSALVDRLHAGEIALLVCNRSYALVWIAAHGRYTLLPGDGPYRIGFKSFLNALLNFHDWSRIRNVAKEMHAIVCDDKLTFPMRAGRRAHCLDIVSARITAPKGTRRGLRGGNKRK